MFLGTYHHTIDPKGRLFIPAKFRDENGNKLGSFILTHGLENCLYLFTPTNFHQILGSKLTSLPLKNKQDARAFKRLLLAGAQEVGLDDLGRILVPKTMIQSSGIKKDVSVLGVGERIELWSRPRWETYQKRASVTFQRLGRQLEI